MNTTKNILLRRKHLVFVPSSKPTKTPQKLVDQFELELAKLGYLVSKDLYGALLNLTKEDLSAVARDTLETLATARGASSWHVPQFRNFPKGTPLDTEHLYHDRVMRFLNQDADAPCLSCNKKAVHALKPCSHLVCTNCFDMSNYSGCPICHRRVDEHTPHFLPAENRGETPQEHMASPVRLTLGTNLTKQTRELTQTFLGRKTPLSPNDREDLLALVDTLGEKALDGLSEIPVRETRGLVLGVLLDSAKKPHEAFERFTEHLTTSTDILRVLNIWSAKNSANGMPDVLDAGLVGRRPRLRGMSRPLRRAIMTRLEALDFDLMAEDMLRHRERWVRLGEALRPFEYHRQYPNVARAFAGLRRSNLDTDLAKSVSTSSTDTLTRVKLETHASKVETALADAKLETAINLLAERPGVLMRRFDNIATRVHTEDPSLEPKLLNVLEKCAPKFSLQGLLTLRSVMNQRAHQGSVRIFFPRGDVAQAKVMEDTRPVLSSAFVDQITHTLTRALVKRADAQTERFGTAVLDEGLLDVLVPFTARTASKSLVDLPRGSAIKIPENDKLRLFLHWTEPKNIRIDLDLSVALYDANWNQVSLCDYTRLRAFQDESAVHSGDLTSAPAPLGASEFVDLDVPALLARGIRHAVMVVYSFNGVAFEKMEDAFAGFMVGRDQRGEVFDARSVEQRFDLTGDARTSIPFIVDLEEGIMRWVDIKPDNGMGYHSISAHSQSLGKVCSAMDTYYRTNARPTMWELAAVEGAAFSDRVLVRTRMNDVLVFERGNNESVYDFQARICNLQNADEITDVLELGDGPVFGALLRQDVEVPDDSKVYALHPELTPNETVEQLSAADLLVML